MIKKGDDKNLFCTNCGERTPLRSVKSGRGLAAPSIQQPATIVQSEKLKGKKTRTPHGINRDKSELEQALLNRGYEVIDSTNVGPTG